VSSRSRSPDPLPPDVWTWLSADPLTSPTMVVIGPSGRGHTTSLTSRALMGLTQIVFDPEVPR